MQAQHDLVAAPLLLGHIAARGVRHRPSHVGAEGRPAAVVRDHFVVHEIDRHVALRRLAVEEPDDVDAASVVVLRDAAVIARRLVEFVTC